MDLVLLLVVFAVVPIAFIVVFNRQSKKLKKIRKVSGRGGDFQEWLDLKTIKGLNPKRIQALNLFSYLFVCLALAMRVKIW